MSDGRDRRASFCGTGWQRRPSACTDYGQNQAIRRVAQRGTLTAILPGMKRRFGWALLPLGVALACSATIDPNEPGANGGGAGAAPAAGSPAAGRSGEQDPPGDTGGKGGEQTVGGDTSPGGAGGAGGDTSSGGAGGAASEHFWTTATQRIELSCFGFFDGFAIFRATRAELSAEQLALLTGQTGVPGSTYDDNDDQIHCVVTTSDAQAQERQFTLDRVGDLLGVGPILGEGGAAGQGGEPAATLLGCEFHHPFSGAQTRPFSANPQCVSEIWPEGNVSTFRLDLARPDTPYHVELVNCTEESLGSTKVELFGTDPATPLATGVTPSDPGRDQACLVLDVRVAVPVVARLVFTSPTGVGPAISEMTFR